MFCFAYFNFHVLQMHGSKVVSVKSLKSLGDKIIKDQHFTTRDFLEAVSYSFCGGLSVCGTIF